MLLGDRYELLRELGSGGFGTVWQATHRELRRDVAVKLLQIDASMSRAERDASIERFRREAQSLASLTHPNIVSAYDFGVDGDTAFLVMELIDGESLAEDLERLILRLLAKNPADRPASAADVRADVARMGDVAAVVMSHDREEILALARRFDPGPDDEDIAAAMRRLDRLDDATFEVAYAQTAEPVDAIRAAFADWPRR